MRRMSFSSFQIEKLSVDGLSRFLAKSKRMAPYIKENDRMPIWDGEIILYSKDGHKAEDVIGKISCQVKGKYRKDAPSSIKYNVKKYELENYLRDGGLIFFVVYLNEESETYYYAKLEPVRIRKYLKDVAGKASASISLERLPSDLSAVEHDFRQFLRDCQYQAGAVFRPVVQMEDIARSRKKFRLVGESPNGDSPFLAVTKGYHYLYTCDENGNIEEPIGDGEFKIELMQEVADSIDFGDITIPAKVMMRLKDGTASLEVGSFFHYELPAIGSSEAMMTVSLNDSVGVRERYLAYRLMLQFHKHSSFKVGTVERSCAEFILPEKDLATIQSELPLTEKVISLLDFLHVKEDFDIYALSEHDRKQLSVVFDAIMKHRALALSEDQRKPCTRSLQIGPLLLLLVQTEEDGQFYVYDFFTADTVEICSKMSDDGVQHSRYSSLSTEDFVSVSNLDSSRILDSYRSLPLVNSEVEDAVNYDVLKMISASDSPKCKHPELLDVALTVMEWLIGLEDGHQKDVYQINRLQILKRKRILSNEEKEQIIAMSEREHSNDELKLCCALLLDDQMKASYHYKKLSPEMREFYKTLPIFKYWKEI